MNVIIKKQCDKPLIYSDHAILRAEERNVPLPKYIPLNAICLAKQCDGNMTSYKLEYDYVGKKYVMVVSESMHILTVYEDNATILDYLKTTYQQQLSMKQYQRNLRQNMTREYYTQKAGKYKHMEFDVEYDSYYQCA